MKDIQTYRHETRRATVRRVNYSSLAEFASDCRLAGVVKNYTHAGESTWWGGDSMGTLLDKCLSGEERHIAKAESLIEQLREEIEIPRSTWSPSAYGAFPDVGSFLAGEIECMRHMQSDPSATTPVRIYFDPTSWAGIDASDLVERGVAALALTMALAQMRPVELWTYSDLDSPFIAPKSEGCVSGLENFGERTSGINSVHSALARRERIGSFKRRHP